VTGLSFNFFDNCRSFRRAAAGRHRAPLGDLGRPRGVIRLGQRHSFAQLAPQNLIFLTEEIILLGQIVAEKLLDLGGERSGGAVKTGFHSVKFS